MHVFFCLSLHCIGIGRYFITKQSRFRCVWGKRWELVAFIMSHSKSNECGCLQWVVACYNSSPKYLLWILCCQVKCIKYFYRIFWMLLLLWTHENYLHSYRYACELLSGLPSFVPPSPSLSLSLPHLYYRYLSFSKVY